MSGNAFSRSAADKAAIEQDNKERKENRLYETLARIGAGTAAGTSQYGLANLGAAANEGVKAYSHMMDKDTADRMKLLDAQLYADKSEDARRSSLTGQMQATLGQMYSKDAALAAARAAAGDPETKLLAKAQALVNNDPVIKGLVRQQKDSGAQPGSPDYQYYEDRIAERNSQIFTFVGLKPPPIQESKVKLPEQPAKEPGIFDKIGSKIGSMFDGNKPETPKAKVVPFNQLPT